MKTFSDPEKDYVYRMFAEYFDHIRLTKIKDEKEWSVYMASLPCLLLNEQRCIVVMTPRDFFPPSHTESIDNMRWISLQTRTFASDTYPDLIGQAYEMKRNGFFEKRIVNISRNRNISTYTVDDLPLLVSLLHIRGNEYEYPNEGTLNSAIETFRTIIQFAIA